MESYQVGYTLQSNCEYEILEQLQNFKSLYFLVKCTTTYSDDYHYREKTNYQIRIFNPVLKDFEFNISTSLLKIYHDYDKAINNYIGDILNENFDFTT